MLKFAAEKFYRLSEELAKDWSDKSPVKIGGKSPSIADMAALIGEMGLESAHDQAQRILNVINEESSTGKIAEVPMESYFVDLHRRVHDDLRRKQVYCIETGRNEFCDPAWLANSPIAKQFPSALKELQSAGRCYAYGEGPASAFHSMRALEVALGVLAAHFGVDFQHSNWHPVIEEIESKIRDISKQPKSDQRLVDEKFFGGLGRHFMFLKNGWRNHVMHVRETYTDREAKQMLDHVTDLITDMCPRLTE